MSRIGILACRCLPLVLLAALAARGEVTFLTETWANGIGSNWSIQAGTPVALGSRLYNSSADIYTPSRLVYASNPPTQDYSVQTDLVCAGNNEAAYYQYLRSSGGYHYRVEASPSAGSLAIWLWRVDSSGTSLLGQTGPSCGAGRLKSSVQGATITVAVDGVTVLSVLDSTLASGKPGVGTQRCTDTNGFGIYTTVLAYTDTQPPTVPTGLTAAALYATYVNLSWTASTDNVVVSGYKVYRDGVYLGSSSTTAYTDLTVDPLRTYSYTVLAYDAEGNQSAQSAPLPVTTPPLSYSAPETGSPVEYAATWGAGPERIALLTSALSLRIPLFRLQQRARGPGFQMIASWNSQFWSWDAAGTKMVGMDVGYGLGWNFTLGGVYPVYSGNEIVRFELQDSAGIIHKLLPTGTANQYKSQDSTYLLWDNANRTLTFTDGTVWTFDCYSRGQEPDAGTRYPTRLRDANGNLIDIVYQPAAGLTGTNSSARISTITDPVSTLTWYYTTINGKLHVTRVNRAGAQSGVDDAFFTYVTPCIGEPFSGADPTCPPGQGNAVLLTQIKITGAPGPFTFDYNTSAEITKFTAPHKGYFRYDYMTASFSNGARKVREIWKRYMAPDGNSASEATNTYTFTHPSGDAALPQHTETTLVDPANNQKVWYFIQGSPNGWDNGLERKYEVRPGPSFSTVLRTIETTWTQDNPASQSLTNPRVASVTSTLEDGVTKSKSERDVDANGNVTQAREYTFGNLLTPYRTTSTTYLTGVNYTSRNILNRPVEVRVCAGPAGCASPASITTITYDSTAITAVPGITQHDTAYGAGFLYRGNPTRVDSNGLISTATYDEGGNLKETKDGLDHVVSSATYNTAASNLASVSSGGSNTTLSYNPDTTLNSATGSNSDTVRFTYSGYRPTRITHPDGTYTSYSYSETTYPFTHTQTSWLGSVTTTTFDGFGRVIKTARKEDATTWIYTETQYGACSCSSTGKSVKTSRPYRTGQTPVWTETRYDALGRPTKVILPDLNETNYTYTVVNEGTWIGTLTLITDPAGKRKRYLHDAFGRLLRVEEPDAANNLIETARYTYDVMGRLTTVQMGKRPDNTFKQTRSFAYNTKGQLLLATNPENGTVSYTYYADGLPASKTDAKGQRLDFYFDLSHRLAGVVSPATGTSTSFTYDTAPDPQVPTSAATGRMTSATNDGYTWHFAYDIMGKVTKQTLQTQVWNGEAWVAGYAQAQYGYDGDGRLRDLYYPGAVNPSPAPGQQYQYGLDLLGRVLSLQTLSGGVWSTLAQSAQYSAAGQITSWQESAGGSWNTLTRSYDSLRGWVSSIQAQQGATTLLNLNYSHLANGRVSAVTDAVNPGQSVSSYEYDQLNRLTKATATNWALQWTYDEFGNRLTQTKVPGSGGTPPEITLSYNETTNRITTAGYTYDLNGNLTALPGISNIAYDVFDRAVSITKAGATSTAKYDAFGRRIERVFGSTKRIYFYDLGGRLLAEYDNPVVGSGPARVIEYFAGQRLGQYTDRIGNVRYSRTGSVYRHYYPFGEEITGTAGNTYKFADLYRDADTGLDYAVHRYYASTIGRFLTPDPYQDSARIGKPQSWNRYPYVLNDPVNFVDPTGLVTVPPIGPVPEAQCVTFFIEALPLLGFESLSQYFNSPLGILGLTMFFENQGRKDDTVSGFPGTRGDSWIGIGWTFINRFRLSEEDKRKYGISTGTLIDVIQERGTGSLVWNGNELLDGFQRQFVTILTGSPDDRRCKGLAEALGTARRVLLTAAGADPAAWFFEPAPNPVGDALYFTSGSRPGLNYPTHITARLHVFRFFAITQLNAGDVTIPTPVEPSVEEK